MTQPIHPPCPRCGARTIKNGIHLGTQRYRCKNCGFQFTRTTPRGRPAADKALAVQLYTLGLSFRAIARLIKVAAPTVLRWVRAFAEKTYEKPEPAEATVVEIDEMWHYLGSKKTKSGSGRLIVVIPTESLTGNVAIVIRKRCQGSLND